MIDLVTEAVKDYLDLHVKRSFHGYSHMSYLQVSFAS